MNRKEFWHLVKFAFKVMYHCVLVSAISLSFLYTYSVDSVLSHKIKNMNQHLNQVRYETMSNLYDMYLQVTSINTALVKLQCNLNHFYESIQKELNVHKYPDYSKLQKSNVRIKQGWGGGSGTVIKIENGYTYVLTAKHVVDGSQTIEIEIPMKDKTYENNKGAHYIKVGVEYVDILSENIYLHKSSDIAMVRFPTLEGHDLAVTPGAPKAGEIGDVIYVIGNPIRLIDNITRGLYSSDRTWSDTDYMVISAPIIFGNSGGAVVNNKGELLGVVSAISQFEVKRYTVYVFHIGLAIPYKTVTPFVQEAYQNMGKENKEKINEKGKDEQPEKDSKYNFTFGT